MSLLRLYFHRSISSSRSLQERAASKVLVLREMLCGQGSLTQGVCFSQSIPTVLLTSLPTTQHRPPSTSQSKTHTPLSDNTDAATISTGGSAWDDASLTSDLTAGPQIHHSYQCPICSFWYADQADMQMVSVTDGLLSIHTIC